MLDKGMTQVEDHGIEPRIATYTAVMNAWGRAGDVSRAARWLRAMLDKGMTPNAVTFSAMIDACAKASDVAGAELWHDRMVEAGIEASIHSFGSVISACAKAGDADKAELWLNRMDELGIEPDVVAFSSVIDACSKADDAERAQRVFRRMRWKGITPNIVTYSTLARPFARHGDWCTVEELEAQLERDGLRMNEYFLYTLLDAYYCAQPRRPDKAEKAFRTAVQSGVRVNDHIKGQLFKILGGVAAQNVIAECRQCGPEARGASGQTTDLAAMRRRGRAREA